MAMFKTSNPALGSKTFQDAVTRSGGAIDAANRMTLSGTVNRTGILLICAFATAAYTWRTFMQTHDPSDVSRLLMLGVFGGFITAMVTVFKQSWAPITAPIYALLEGLFLGGISAFFELRYPGIAIQAVGLTFGSAADHAGGLQFRPDQGDEQASHRHHRGYGRHCAVLPA